jgi:hypothetical protein
MADNRLPLPDSLIALIRRWIEPGAADDSNVTPPPP